jgi:hypothetical protein
MTCGVSWSAKRPCPPTCPHEGGQGARRKGLFLLGFPTAHCCAGGAPCKQGAPSGPSPTARVPGSPNRRGWAGVKAEQEWRPEMNQASGEIRGVSKGSDEGRNDRQERLVGVNEGRSEANRVIAARSRTGHSTRDERLGPLPRLLLTREESARCLGMSLRHFQRHVQPVLPCVYSGQLRLYRLRDLERWTAAEASLAGRS